MDSCNSYLIVNPALLKKEGLVNLYHDVQMNFADSWARFFVVITFLTFGEAQIIGGIVPNLIAFELFLEAIGYFALTGKMAEMFGWSWKKSPLINKKKASIRLT